jgi:hypothetical protein
MRSVRSVRSVSSRLGRGEARVHDHRKLDELLPDRWHPQQPERRETSDDEGEREHQAGLRALTRARGTRCGQEVVTLQHDVQEGTGSLGAVRSVTSLHRGAPLVGAS